MFGVFLPTQRNLYGDEQILPAPTTARAIATVATAAAATASAAKTTSATAAAATTKIPSTVHSTVQQMHQQ